MPAITGFADIPSNFDVNDFINVVGGADANCQQAGPHPTPGMGDLGEGKLRFLCGPAHLSYNDPIVYPGQEGASHLHHFFGNDSTDHNSTYASLRGAGNGTCAGGAINRTGYWFPAMIKPAGPDFPVPKVVLPAAIELYYHNEPDNLTAYESLNYPGYETEAMVPFANGHQMVWGWKHDHPIPDPDLVWGRDNLDAMEGFTRLSTLPELYRNTGRFNTPHEGTGYHDNIIARTTSPGCWDGVNLVLPGGRDHIARGFQDGLGKLICPESHPYRIPAITVIIWWSNNGPEDWRHWYLSVDRHTGHNLDGGHGFHTDWFGAWDSDIQAIWEDEHLALGYTEEEAIGTLEDLGQAKLSSSGYLCRDDKQLDSTGMLPNRVENGYGSYHLPEEYRYADIPNIPGQKRLRLNLQVPP